MGILSWGCPQRRMKEQGKELNKGPSEKNEGAGEGAKQGCGLNWRPVSACSQGSSEASVVPQSCPTLSKGVDFCNSVPVTGQVCGCYGDL